LVARQAVLLCDEPLSHLDADLRERQRAEIATLARENDTTVMYITPRPGRGIALADRIGVLKAGRLVQCDLPESAYHAPATPFVARFTGIAGELHGRVGEPTGLRGTFLGGHTQRIPEGVWTCPRTQGIRCHGPRSSRRSKFCLGCRRGHWPAQSSTRRRGHGYDHLIELGNGTRLAGVFAEQRRQRGEEVRVRLDPDGCFVYRVDDNP
jgi:iron(III) transport system ATP-binding protein